MYDKMYDIVIKASSRTFHHDVAKYLDMAHSGESIVITKRGKVWATLSHTPATEQPKKPKKLDWKKVFERTHENFKGRKVKAVEALLKMRAEARW